MEAFIEQVFMDAIQGAGEFFFWEKKVLESYRGARVTNTLRSKPSFLFAICYIDMCYYERG